MGLWNSKYIQHHYAFSGRYECRSTEIWIRRFCLWSGYTWSLSSPARTGTVSHTDVIRGMYNEYSAENFFAQEWIAEVYQSLLDGFVWQSVFVLYNEKGRFGQQDIEGKPSVFGHFRPNMQHLVCDEFFRMCLGEWEWEFKFVEMKNWN